MLGKRWKAPPLQVQFVKSISEKTPQGCVNIDKAVVWARPIRTYLESGELPEDEIETRPIIRIAPNYKIIDGTLYKKGFFTPFLICVTQPETTTTKRSPRRIRYMS